MSNPNNKPVRLTEHLQRADLQNRVNNLSEVLEVMHREQKETSRDLDLMWEHLRYQSVTIQDYERQEQELQNGSKHMPGTQISLMHRAELKSTPIPSETYKRFQAILESKQEQDKEA